MQTTKFFSKVGSWFKVGAAGRGHSAALGDVDDHGLLKSSGTEEKTTVGTLLSRWQERTQSLQRLEDGYQRLNELVESIQKHLENQDRRSHKIAEALSALKEPITQLPESMHKQQEQLRAIADELATANARSGRLESSITELPNIANAQRETLVAVREEIGATRETQARVADSLGGFRDAVTSLNRASDASVASFRELQVGTAASHERLAALLADQNKKTNTVVLVAIATAAVLTVATVASMLVRG